MSFVERLRSDRGEVMAYIVVLLPALVGFVGLAHDTGRLFEERREAQNIAAAAARKGANEVDLHSVYVELDRSLDEGEAIQTAERFAIDHGVSDVTARTPQPDRVTVSIRGDSSTVFLGIFGVDSFGYEVESTAIIEFRAGSR